MTIDDMSGAETPGESGENDQSVLEVLPDDQDLLDGLITGSKLQQAAFRLRTRVFDELSVHPADVERFEELGWRVMRSGKNRVRLRTEKPHNQLIEDRAWCLLYRLGYTEISSDAFKIRFRRESGTTDSKQIDAFACDSETAIVVECKSRAERGRRSLQKELGETVALQQYIRNRIFAHYGSNPKPKIIWIYVTSNIIWSEPDVLRARDANVYIVTENELHYFETFLRHMGPAGRYQILGEFLKGQQIPALRGHRVPAIKGTLGGHVFYSFVTSPRVLLKIAFINHQALNHPDGKPAYQRMISPSRIKEIGRYISEKGGYFPTNLLINFVVSPRFDLLPNKENSDPKIKFGWLTLPSLYRSAWVIDGQHRLYGYSGLGDKEMDQSLFVLAFDKMDTYSEADLFITINHKQKSVKRSLLVSLLADLRMGDPDPKTALSAIASAVVRRLNADKTSPLYQRFAAPDVVAGPSQNLTISEVVNGLNRSGLLGKVLHKAVVPGPLSGPTDSETIARAFRVLSGYFERLRAANPARWEAGRSGYVCVNPGLRAHVMLIPEIISYLGHKRGIDFVNLSEDQFLQEILSVALPVIDHLGSSSDEDVKANYSRKFGEGGVKEYIFNLCEAAVGTSPDFGSDEFKRYLAQRASNEVEETSRFLLKLSEKMTDCVVKVLKRRYGEQRLASGEPAYWEVGVSSKTVKEAAYKKQQADKLDRRKPKEAYLDIVDLKEIIEETENWLFFEAMFSHRMPGDRKGQQKYTGWIVKFNEVRNIAAHKNELRTYTDADFELVDWLRAEVEPKIEAELTRP